MLSVKGVLWAPLHHLCLINFVPIVSIDPFKSFIFYEFHFYHTFSRLIPISYTRGIIGRASRLSVECTPLTTMPFSSSPSPQSAELCSMSVHRSVKELDFYRILSKLIPISYTRGIIGRAVVSCRSNVHPPLSCLSAPPHHLCLLHFFHECASIRLRIWFFTRQANTHIIMRLSSWDGHSQLSVECTPPHLVSISSSASPPSATLRSISEHRSGLEFDFYHILCGLIPILYTSGTIRRAVVGYPSSVSPCPMSAKLCFMSVHQSVQDLEFYSIFSRIMPILHASGILRRAIVGCPSNAQNKHWCLQLLSISSFC